MSRRQRLVVVGAGYAGAPLALSLATQLAKKKLQQSWVVQWIAPETRMERTCELYKTLRDGQGRYFDFSSAVHSSSLEFIEGQVVDCDPTKRELTVRGSSKSSVPYDAVVFCTGRQFQFPPLEGLEEQSKTDPLGLARVFGVHTNAQVLALRLALQRLRWTSGTGTQGKDTFVIILGAGATGLEFAGEIAALRGKNPKARVVLVDQRAELGSDLPKIAKTLLRKQLADLGIECILGSKAKSLDSSYLHLANGQQIPWNVLVMATEKRARPPFLSKLSEQNSTPVTAQSILVDGHLQLRNHPMHFVAGDLATGSWPASAQAATQMASYLSKYLSAKLWGGPLDTQTSTFEFFDKGSLIALGPSHGVGRLGPEPTSTITAFTTPFLFGVAVNPAKDVVAQEYLFQLSRLMWTLRFRERFFL